MNETIPLKHCHFCNRTEEAAILVPSFHNECFGYLCLGCLHLNATSDFEKHYNGIFNGRIKEHPELKDHFEKYRKTMDRYVQCANQLKYEKMLNKDKE